MTPAAGADLSSAVAAAGGLGLLAADTAIVLGRGRSGGMRTRGVGFSLGLSHNNRTARLRNERHPRAVMFGPVPIRRLCAAHQQAVCLSSARSIRDQALPSSRCRADIVVDQGTEAGGHGKTARSTLQFVPDGSGTP